MEKKFYSFSQYLKEKFGKRIHRISLDAGFSCPNIDGILSKHGCIYCNNKAFSIYTRKVLPLRDQIIQSINYYKKRMKVTSFIAYFQAFTNTYASVDDLREKYNVIRDFPEIVGLFISTRPDCVDKKKLALISQYQREYLVWIEYGLQTTHNRILKLINRNHTYEDFLRTLELTRSYGINVGVHIILGLPQQSYEEMMLDAERLASLDIQGIKFHILHVLKDTVLESWYREGRLELLSKDEFVRIICDFLEIIPPHFVVLRLVSTADPAYLIAPKWINQRSKVLYQIEKELEKRGTHQGFRYESIGCPY